MAMILKIDDRLLSRTGRSLSVSMVDSGFSHVPEYAIMHGGMFRSNSEHGDRILSIFTALDSKYPIEGTMLHLSCYDTRTGYDGLLRALSALPESDVLSVSMLWRDDDERVRKIMESRFGTVVCPVAKNGLKYPAAYPFARTCSDVNDAHADFCIRPNSEWRGSSYAVPAVVRLMCHNEDVNALASDDGVSVEKLFSECRTEKPVEVVPAGMQTCWHCRRVIRDRGTHGMIVLDEGTPCPYCGFPLKK